MASEATSAAQQRLQTMHAELRRRISLLDYPPGHALAETELAEDFGVSRTPVRTVLGWLAHDGLVVSRHGVGTLVTDVDIDALLPIFDLRMHLSELSGQLDPVPASAADLAALDDLHERVRALPPQLSRRELGVVEHEFHEQYLRRIGNAPLREIIDRLFYQANRFWLWTLPAPRVFVAAQRLVAQIAQTREALDLGDLRAVGLLQRNAISVTLRHVQRERRLHPDETTP